MMLEAALWNASAGKSTPLPAAGDLVYYFPERHVEHAYIMPDFILSSHVHQVPVPMFLCRVAAVHLSAHPISDEVFAKFTLDPLPVSTASDTVATATAAPQPRPPLPDGFPYHAKVLTASDVGKGTALTIPCKCANAILPKLDYKLNPPTQFLTFFDVHGKAWEFKHIYRGNPRRHLITTGWSKFVESKMLVQGDTAIFIRGPDGRLFIRIRRACTNPPNRFISLHEVEFAGEEGCFTRRTPCRISQKSVEEAASMAAAGRPFEVIYYPNSGLPEFVVAKELLDEPKKVSFTGFYQQNYRLPPSQLLEVSFTGFYQQKYRLPPSPLLETKKRKAVNPCHVEYATTTPFYPDLKRFKNGKVAGQEGPHGEGCSASTTSVSDAPASEIITPANNRSQKTFKLFGNIIPIEEERKETEEEDGNQDFKTFNFFPVKKAVGAES